MTEAIETLEAAIDRLGAVLLPCPRVALLIDLARLREGAGDREAAARDAKAAAATLADLGVALRPADVALLQRLASGLPADAKAAPGARTGALARDGKWWVASCAGSHLRMQDTKGLRYLALLIARPGAERHVLDLVDRVEGVAPPGGPDRRKLGDAGEMLDARARADYRRRIERLRGEIDVALAAEQLEAAEARQAELDDLVAGLAQAFGLEAGIGARRRRPNAPASTSRGRSAPRPPG